MVDQHCTEGLPHQEKPARRVPAGPFGVFSGGYIITMWKVLNTTQTPIRDAKLTTVGIITLAIPALLSRQSLGSPKRLRCEPRRVILCDLEKKWGHVPDTKRGRMITPFHRCVGGCNIDQASKTALRCSLAIAEALEDKPPDPRPPETSESADRFLFSAIDHRLRKNRHRPAWETRG